MPLNKIFCNHLLGKSQKVWIRIIRAVCWCLFSLSTSVLAWIWLAALMWRLSLCDFICSELHVIFIESLICRIANVVLFVTVEIYTVPSSMQCSICIYGRVCKLSLLIVLQQSTLKCLAHCCLNWSLRFCWASHMCSMAAISRTSSSWAIRFWEWWWRLFSHCVFWWGQLPAAFT